MSNIDQKAKTRLAELLSAVQPVVQAQIESMSQAEITHILDNYGKFLKLDLERDFREAKKQADNDPAKFDDLFSGITEERRRS